MELLKKGIVLGMGAHDMNKKQIEDFAHKLYENRIIPKEEREKLVETILKRKSSINQHIESKIENYIRTMFEKEKLATIDHVSYLEKRIDFLEEELYNLLLDKYLDSMDDREIEGLLKDLDTLPTQSTSKSMKKHKECCDDYDCDEEYLDKLDKDVSKYVQEVDERDLELDDLLSLTREGGIKMAKKKKAVKKALKKAPKKKAAKKKKK